LIDRIKSSIDPSLAEFGKDPTEVMERIRVERETSRTTNERPSQRPTDAGH
jgi:hypothetical protein